MFSEKTQYLIDTLPGLKIVFNSMYVEYTKNTDTNVINLVDGESIIEFITKLLVDVDRIENLVIIFDNVFNIQLKENQKLHEFANEIRELVQPHSNKIIVII